MIDEDEVQIGVSLVDPSFQLDNLQDDSDSEDGEKIDQIKFVTFDNAKTQEVASQSQFVDDDSPEFEVKAAIDFPTQSTKSKIIVDEDEIQNEKVVANPDVQLNQLLGIDDGETDIEKKANAPSLPVADSLDDMSTSIPINASADTDIQISNSRGILKRIEVPVTEEDLADTRVPVTDCSLRFDESTKLLGFKEIDSKCEEKKHAKDVISEARHTGNLEQKVNSSQRIDMNVDDNFSYSTAVAQQDHRNRVSKAKIVSRADSVHQDPRVHKTLVNEKRFDSPSIVKEIYSKPPSSVNDLDVDPTQVLGESIAEENPSSTNNSDGDHTEAIEVAVEVIEEPSGPSAQNLNVDLTHVLGESVEVIDVPELKDVPCQQGAMRNIVSASETSNGGTTSITIQVDQPIMHDDITKTQDEVPTKPNTLTPKGKKQSGVSPGRKHSRTKKDKELLSNYDIIDRTEVKGIKPQTEIFSFAQLFNRVRSVFTVPVPTAKDENDGYEDDEYHPFVQSSIVNVSIQQTKEGEEMQVITVNNDHSQDYLKSEGMVVVVDEMYEDELCRGSDEESAISESDDDDDDDDGLDSPDSIAKISYDLKEDKQVPQAKETYKRLGNENEVHDDVKSQTIGRTQLSKSFGFADRGEVSSEKINQRRVTLGSPNIFNRGVGMLPFQSLDFGTLKKKTLPNEPFLLMTDGYPVNLPSFPSDRRSLIVQEIYTTERTFIRGLEIIVLLFKRRIEMSNLLDAKEIKQVFSNITEILKGNRELLEDIFDRVTDWSDEQCIGDLFMKYEDHFRIYSEYAKNYDTSEALIKQKMKKKKDLETLLAACYTNPVCVSGLTLPSYLITVIQRIPRYILLLRDVIKRTNDNHPDLENLVKSQEMMEKVAKFINEQLKQAHSAKALEALQTQIVGLKAFYTPDRNLVHEGDVSLLTTKKTYHCVLFNDLLVFAVKSGVRQTAVELDLDIKTVWIEDLEDLDPQTTKRDAIGIYTPERPYTMYVGSVGEKKIWLQQLNQAIRQHLQGKNANEKLDLDTRNTNYTYKDDSVYSGYYYQAKRHGKGMRLWRNLMTYDGTWEDDERNGYGVLEYLSGDVYEGIWVDDRQDGEGTYKYKNGDIATGAWENGKKHGLVEIQYHNGDIFKGNFRYDRIDGEGELKCKSGYHYKGEWKMNLKHGKGTLLTAHSLEYTGDFKHDQFHGHGELRYADGSIYKGEFEHGDRCGHGVYTVPGGLSYEGQWTHDLKDGRGKMTYENGDVYNGTWMDDMRIGQGVITYNYGGYYRGQWQSDLRHGSGVYEMKDGSLYDGEFFNNKICGTGKMKYRNGPMHNGQWKDNLPNGKGILTKPGGFNCDGTWLLGKQAGFCTLNDPVNKYSYEGEWVNGIREGKGKETFEGSVYEGHFVQNLRDGGGIERWPDGSVFEGKWSCGQKHGRGIKKKKLGVIEHQIWDCGCLIKTNITLPPNELSTISRWQQ